MKRWLLLAVGASLLAGSAWAARLALVAPASDIFQAPHQLFSNTFDELASWALDSKPSNGTVALAGLAMAIFIVVKSQR